MVQLVLYKENETYYNESLLIKSQVFFEENFKNSDLIFCDITFKPPKIAGFERGDIEKGVNSVCSKFRRHSLTLP